MEIATLLSRNTNRGRNWKALNFNREVWLTLLGLPLDYWAQECLEQAITSFGRLISWERDLNKLGRLILKARVIDLESVPHFIVVTDGERAQGESWTVQCEILQQEMLQELTPDEDPEPDNSNGQEPPINFFGFGQQMPGFHQQQMNAAPDANPPAENWQNGPQGQNASQHEVIEGDPPPFQLHGNDWDLNMQLLISRRTSKRNSTATKSQRILVH
jgi:hypothetical protein